jgi:hypothetical protein
VTTEPAEPTASDVDVLREQVAAALCAHDRSLPRTWDYEEEYYRALADAVVPMLQRQVAEVARLTRERDETISAEQVAYIKAATLQEEANWWEQVRPTAVGRTQFGTWLRGRAEVHLRTASVPARDGEQ